MTSSPLFISVEESMDILAPIFQVGCARAWTGVTASKSAIVLPRNGPPEAVTHSFETSRGFSPSRHW